jgi:hypothetical protein
VSELIKIDAEKIGEKTLFLHFVLGSNPSTCLRVAFTCPNALGGYSQNFLGQILKIFVTLSWIFELISYQK